MKLLVSVLFVVACTAGEDTTVAPDAAVEMTAADAATCAPRVCGDHLPMVPQVSAMHNADGTVTLSADDYQAITAYFDYSQVWIGCETH